MHTVGIDTNEGHDMKKDTETRIREIQAEVAAIDEFAEGSIASSRKPYRLKDGTVRLASPQYRFKSKGARGKQVSKYMPPSAVARVKKLIENGRRYRKLEAEYSRLVTEASLAALKKRQAKADPAAPAPRQRHRARRVHRAGRPEGEAQGAAAL